MQLQPWIICTTLNCMDGCSLLTTRSPSKSKVVSKDGPPNQYGQMRTPGLKDSNKKKNWPNLMRSMRPQSRLLKKKSASVQPKAVLRRRRKSKMIRWRKLKLRHLLNNLLDAQFANDLANPAIATHSISLLVVVGPEEITDIINLYDSNNDCSVRSILTIFVGMDSSYSNLKGDFQGCLSG